MMISEITKNHDIQSTAGKAILARPAGKAFTLASPNKVVIDRKAALERTMGDEQFLSDLLQEFMAGLSDVKDRIGNAINHQNVAAVTEEANRLAGAAGNLGAMGLSDAASHLEAIVRKGCVEKAQDVFRQLVLEVDKFILHFQSSEFGNIQASP